MTNKNCYEDYLHNIIKKYNKDGFTEYFNVKNFKSLKEEKIIFLGKNKEHIVGYLNYYSPIKKDDIVIFVHGLSIGHYAYMKEINMLCKKGYFVISFDQLGCGNSDGKNIDSFFRGIDTLNIVINQVKEKYKQKKIILIGHSWGGFSISYNLLFHPDIKRAVIISSPNSFKGFILSLYKNISEIEKEKIIEYEYKKHGEIIKKEINEILNNTNIPCLIMHSRNDFIVPIKFGLINTEEKINNPLVSFYINNGHYHSPHYDLSASKYLYSFTVSLNYFLLKNPRATLEEKQKFIKQFDFNKMTKQDNFVWKMIFNFIA